MNNSNNGNTENTFKRRGTVVAWAQVETNFNEIRNKKLNLLEEDDTQANNGCGDWYFDAKEVVGRDVYIPESLVGVYQATTFVVLFDFVYWCICCFFIPVIGMHGIEKFVTSDIR